MSSALSAQTSGHMFHCEKQSTGGDGMEMGRSFCAEGDETLRGRMVMGVPFLSRRGFLVLIGSALSQMEAS